MIFVDISLRSSLVVPFESSVTFCDGRGILSYWMMHDFE